MSQVTTSQKLPFSIQFVIDILSGTMAGINATLVGYPLDTMKVKMQMFPEEYEGLMSCARSIFRNDGPSEFYRGVSSPLVGQMLFRSVLFFSQNETKRQVTKDGKIKISALQMYEAGAIAWGIGALVECPIDVIKCQLQVQKNLVSRGGKVKYLGTGDAFLKILRMRGVNGIYQGFGAHLMRNIPAGACHLGTYDLLKHNYASKYGINPKDVPLWFSMVAGAIGGLMYWAPFYPLDCVKNVIQSQNPDPEKRQYKGYVETWAKLYKEGGLKRFYSGFTPCLVRAIPVNAVMLVTASESNYLLRQAALSRI